MHDDQRARGGTAARSGDPSGSGSTGSSGRIEDHRYGRLLDGRYRIGVRIARGGMASVYEAVDTRLDRTVAVKIMHPGLGDSTTQDDESFARRFVSEAKAAARLSHPNVVAVFDQGRDASDGTVYLVMEYVPGHTLRDTIVKDAPMSPERALAILDPILSALGAAHRAGLIHRDVKPENVLIADDGRIKVADFGLAKAVSADTQHTATNGVLIGTVSYLAPELVVEQRADARADVYAAGVILYELLTGTKPHTGETPIAVAYRHVHEDVPAPSSVSAGIPDYVDALVARATVRDASLRSSDATVLLHHVRRVSHALHEGLRSDPELVDDLLPASRVVEPDDTGDAAVGGDTTPEPVTSLWDGMPVIVEKPAPRRTPPPPPAAPRERTTVLGPPPSDPPTPPPARRPRGRRIKRIALALVVVLLAGAIGGGAWYVGWGRYTTTPGVIGLDQAAAQAKLDKAGLSVKVAEEVHSESVEAGRVISTDPRPGARILPDGEVRLTVSLGPERYDLPDLTNLTVEEAEAALADVKFVKGQQSEKWSETVEAGRVITTQPAFGSPEASALPVGTSVSLVVSKGRKPIKVRSFVGKDADQAEKVLQDKKGLVVEVVDERYSDDVAEGKVISQTPDSGTLFKGETVQLVVSKGPELVAVPAVRFLRTDDAVKKLEDLGFVVRKEEAAIYVGGATAWDTDPKSGNKLPKGSTIVLYVV